MDSKKYQCSADLFDLLKNLRDAQKRFFKSAPGSLDRANALQDSKTYERELDAFLKTGGQEQPDLFTTNV